MVLINKENISATMFQFYFILLKIFWHTHSDRFLHPQSPYRLLMAFR